MWLRKSELFTKVEARQIQDMICTRRRDGWYYGVKIQFEKRETKILDKLPKFIKGELYAPHELNGAVKKRRASGTQPDGPPDFKQLKGWKIGKVKGEIKWKKQHPQRKTWPSVKPMAL